jgi:hypothetical protein
MSILIGLAIPAAVVDIGARAFDGCPAFVSLVFGAATASYPLTKTIGESAFGKYYLLRGGFSKSVRKITYFPVPHTRHAQLGCPDAVVYYVYFEG